MSLCGNGGDGPADHESSTVTTSPPKAVNLSRGSVVDPSCMTKFLLWLLLFILCWPLALFALVLYPIVWLLTLPFRLVGIAVGGVFELLRAIVLLPARLLGARV